MESHKTLELDLTGKHCPIPILETKKALRNLEQGDLLKVTTTDPHSEIDFKAFLSRTEYKLLECRKDDDIYFFCIEK